MEKRDDEGTPAGVVASVETFVGRGEERRRVDDLLERVRAKHSQTLLVEGDPGVGKTELLRYAMLEATDMRVVFAPAVEADAVLPFATLTALLAPFDGCLDDLLSAQRVALDAALGRGSPAPVDRLAVGAATLTCLSLAAEAAPILLVIDDGHWVDPSSTEALLFASRRLGHEGVGMLVASREGEPHRFSRAGLPTLRLEALEASAALALVGTSMSPEVAELIVASTGGNPLAILELRELLTEAQRRGLEPLPDPLPVGDTLHQAYVRRVGRLSDVAHQLLTVAAADGGAMVGVLLEAARALEINATALDEIVATGLVVTIDNRVLFAHPLLRSAVYNGATDDARRQAHQALASALRREDDLDRRAWHLAAAVATPDEGAAGALEDAARSAHLRSAFAVAGVVYERAAALTPDDQDRSRRLASAGDSFRLGGRSARAVEAFSEALGLAHDPLVRTDVQLKGGAMGLLTQSLRPLHKELVSAAADIEHLDADKASALLAQAALSALTVGRVREAQVTAARAASMAGDGSPAELAASVMLAMTHLALGEVEEASPILEDFLVMMQTDGPNPGWFGLAENVANGLMWTERFGDARQVLEAMIGLARSLSAPAMLPFALAVRAEASFWSGDWSAAMADAWEAVNLARDAEQTVLLPYPLVTLARTEGGLGHAAGAFDHLDEARRVAQAFANRTMLYWAHAAQGFVELSLGQLDEARAQLQLTAHSSDEQGFVHPSSLTWRADLVEVLVRLDDITAAAEALKSLEETAARLPGSWPRAAVSCGRGMLASTNFDRHFEEALAAYDEMPVPFQRARTELCFGERLRRTQYRTEALRRLRAARQAFVQLGAGPWITRANAELAACGEHATGPKRGRLDELTPQELRVATVTSAGASNREVAAALFLSRRTVEHHLGSVYRKLGLRSRSQLVAVLAREGRLDRLAQ